MVATTSGPSPLDVVTATLAASAALAGGVLVFLGVVIGAIYQVAEGLPRKAELAPYERMQGVRRLITVVLYTMGTFCVSLASVGVSLLWLSVPGGEALYEANIWLFIFELLVVFGLVLFTATLVRVRFQALIAGDSKR